MGTNLESDSGHRRARLDGVRQGFDPDMLSAKSRRVLSILDQTYLDPTVSMGDAESWVSRNAPLGFGTLCVSPWLVPLTFQALVGYPTKTCTVVGFPYGYQETVTKVAEAARLIDLGAEEIDMMANYGALMGDEGAYVYREISQVVDIARQVDGRHIVVKVILETGRLTEEQIRLGSELALHAGADFVKTSTGREVRGATIEDVELIRSVVGDGVGVKASGGIRDLATFEAMVAAGATRVGTSAGIAIVEELIARDGYSNV